MRRREFITLIGAATTWPLALRAQQSERLRRVSVLLGVPENDPETKSRVRAFRLGMRDAGWIEGRNVQIEFRYAGTDPDTIEKHIAELIRLAPNVILASYHGLASTGDKHNSSYFRRRKLSSRSRVHSQPRASGRQHHRVLIYRARNSRQMDQSA